MEFNLFRDVIPMTQERKFEIIVKEPSARSIFNEVISSLKIGMLKIPDDWDSGKGFQKAFVGFFTSLGRKSGYYPWPEYMKIDCPWLLDLPTVRSVGLAMEHQNTESVNYVIKQDIPKLCRIKSKLKILVYYPNQKDLKAHIKRIGKEIAKEDLKLEEEEWLVLTFSYIDAPDTSKVKILVSGYKGDYSGNFSEVGSKEFSFSDVTTEVIPD